MPGPKGDEYWANWAYGYCQVAKVSLYPNRDYGLAIGEEPKTISTTVHRLRARGLMTPKSVGNFLTEKAEALLNQGGFKGAAVVAFDLRLRAKSKEEALAEVWDVISQLEHWDPRTGQPFKLRQGRGKIGAGDNGLAGE